jgi:hypothetical protein
MCEREGLTLAQANERGRLYRETFYVCRNCGKDGETIQRQIFRDLPTLTVRGAMKWGWGSAAIIVPLLVWMRWWQGVAVIGATLLALPGAYWWENRKIARALAARGLPRPDAPGLLAIAEPAAGCIPGTVIGQRLPFKVRGPSATGPCCDRPDWVEAAFVKDEDRVPYRDCGHGVMLASEHAIH